MNAACAVHLNQELCDLDVDLGVPRELGVLYRLRSSTHTENRLFPCGVNAAIYQLIVRHSLGIGNVQFLIPEISNQQFSTKKQKTAGTKISICRRHVRSLQTLLVDFPRLR
jgi:hypothetical protein